MTLHHALVAIGRGLKWDGRLSLGGPCELSRHIDPECEAIYVLWRIKNTSDAKLACIASSMSYDKDDHEI